MRWLTTCFLLCFAICSTAQVEPVLDNLLIQFPNTRDFTIHGDEAYFTAQSPIGEISVIMKTQKIGERWRQPTIAPFSGEFHDLEPFLSPEGLRLYFVSNRPLDPTDSATKDYDIWYLERASRSDNWSDPINIGTPINTAGNEFFPSVASNGNMYFTTDAEGTKGLDDIFFAPWNGSEYGTPVSMDTTINSEGYEFNAYITPNDSMLIFTGYTRIDGFGSGDLYVSYRGEDGVWQTAEHLAEPINSAEMDYCPFLSDGTLYFTSRRSELGTEEKILSSLEDLLQLFHSYSNGMSRIYQIPWSTNKE